MKTYRVSFILAGKQLDLIDTLVGGVYGHTRHSVAKQIVVDFLKDKEKQEQQN